MSSFEISELTGKRHHHILRDIRELNKAYGNLGKTKIGFSNKTKELHNGERRTYPYSNLTKMQTLDLLTGYSAELRIKVNRRWAELEEKEIMRVPQPRQYNGIPCIHYTSWLLQNGYSLMSSRVGGRIRQYPEQFRKGKDGWYMSQSIADYFLAFRDPQKKADQLPSINPNQLSLF